MFPLSSPLPTAQGQDSGAAAAALGLRTGARDAGRACGPDQREPLSQPQTGLSTRTIMWQSSLSHCVQGCLVTAACPTS